MAKRQVVISTKDASTLDILNTIRMNASQQYQDLVPEVTDEKGVLAVGDVLFGYPGLANEFLSSLMNRIAFEVLKSLEFTNPYSDLNKGVIANGQIIEDIFIGMANSYAYSAEKGAAREFKRSVPDVKSAFYSMNWRVVIPTTIQQNDLTFAFNSLDGVTRLVTKIIQQVYQTAEYQDFLLYKYLIIKNIAKGHLAPLSIGNVSTVDGLKNGIATIRATSTKLTFPSTKYNRAGVKTNTPKERQIIFIDADWEAQVDVNVLAAAFNMDKAEYLGARYLVDNWAEFDNEAFEDIRKETDMIEEVTEAELNIMKNVKAVLVDREWFQVYTNLQQMRETQVNAGLYYNYFYHVWKTIATSPYANAIVMVTDSADISLPTQYTTAITAKSTSDDVTVLTVEGERDQAALLGSDMRYIQTREATEAGIAIHPYGAVIIPANAPAIALEFEYNGGRYKSTTNIDKTADVGDEITFTKQ